MKLSYKDLLIILGIAVAVIVAVMTFAVKEADPAPSKQTGALLQTPSQKISSADRVRQATEAVDFRRLFSVK